MMGKYVIALIFFSLPASAEIIKGNKVASFDGYNTNMITEVFHFHHNGNDCYVTEKMGNAGFNISCVRSK